MVGSDTYKPLIQATSSQLRRLTLSTPSAFAASSGAHAVDEVAGKAFLGAVVGRLRGESVGEFRSWLNTIVDRRIADFHRRRNRPHEVPLAREHEGDEEIWGEMPKVEDEAAAVETAAVIDQVLATMSPVHGRVVEVYAFDQAPADETADHVNAELIPNPPMTRDNVHQIYSRFRRQLVRALAGEGDTPVPHERRRSPGERIHRGATGRAAMPTPAPTSSAWRARSAPSSRALIDAYLARAPRRSWDAEAFRGSAAEAMAEALEKSLDGVAGLWPAVLPGLRERARLKRSDLVARLADALDVSDRREKVAEYYHRMEQGTLAAGGVSDRVLDALGKLVGTSAAALRGAGQATVQPGGAAPGAGAVFARTAQPDEAWPDPAAPGPQPAAPASREQLDDVDRLFTGGP